MAVMKPIMVEFQRLNHTVARAALANSFLPNWPTNPMSCGERIITEVRHEGENEFVAGTQETPSMNTHDYR
jgi:hypothetical protein